VSQRSKAGTRSVLVRHFFTGSYDRILGGVGAGEAVAGEGDGASARLAAAAAASNQAVGERCEHGVLFGLPENLARWR